MVQAVAESELPAYCSMVYKIINNRTTEDITLMPRTEHIPTGQSAKTLTASMQSAEELLVLTNV